MAGRGVLPSLGNLGPDSRGRLSDGHHPQRARRRHRDARNGWAWDKAKQYVEDGNPGGLGCPKGRDHRGRCGRSLPGQRRPRGQSLIAIVNLVALLILPVISVFDYNRRA